MDAAFENHYDQLLLGIRGFLLDMFLIHRIIAILITNIYEMYTAI